MPINEVSPVSVEIWAVPAIYFQIRKVPWDEMGMWIQMLLAHDLQTSLATDFDDPPPNPHIHCKLPLPPLATIFCHPG